MYARLTLILFALASQSHFDLCSYVAFVAGNVKGHLCSEEEGERALAELQELSFEQ